MAPIKVTFKTVQGNKFELDLDSAEKVRISVTRLLHSCALAWSPSYDHAFCLLIECSPLCRCKP